MRRRARAPRRRCARAAPGAGRIRAGAAPRTSRASPGCRSRSSIGTPASSQPGRSQRPSPRLASVLGQRTMPAPLAATAAISCAVEWVAWTSCQRASRPAFANEPLDRPRAGRADALVDLAGLLGDVDVDRPGERLRRASRSAAIDAALAARSEWIASPESTRGRAAARMRCAASNVSAGEERKRRWSSRSASAAKPARSYSTGRIVRPMPASAAASASAHDIASGSAYRCRRGRGAGSGTRTRACSRRAAARRRAARRRRAAAPASMRRATRVHALAPRPEVVARRVAPLGERRRRRAGTRGCARRRRRAGAARRGRARLRAAVATSARHLDPAPVGADAQRRRSSRQPPGSQASGAQSSAGVASAAIGAPVERRLQELAQDRPQAGEAAGSAAATGSAARVSSMYVASPISSWIACTPSCGRP